jgi:biotin-dependent carboxylase-like uncharacterized protein
MSLRVLAAGPGLSLQDAGRPGYLRYGVSESGPMDWAAHALANRLLGNAPGAAALEIGPGGARFVAQTGLAAAVAGTGFQITVDGHAHAAPVAGGIAAGQQIEVRPGRAGMWAYLALAGGIDAPDVLGSAAHHARAGLGHRVGEGDALPPCHQSSVSPGLAQYADPLAALPDGPLGVVRGPQDHMFSNTMKARLTEAEWRISARADRMGYRLEGPKLAAELGSDIVSEGIVMGSIQVPGDGQPIVLMADRQPTGGYAKIGVVCRADVRRLAQTRPGEAVSFAWITVEEALARLRRVREAINAPLRRLGQAPSAEGLLRANLISGVTGAEHD